MRYRASPESAGAARRSVSTFAKACGFRGERLTDLELAAFPGRGITHLAVACPSFVADCLETLEEIDIRGRRTFLSAGGTSFRYLPCPNDDERWIRALARLCSEPAAVKQ